MAHLPHSLSLCNKHCFRSWTSSADSERRIHPNSPVCVLKFRPLSIRVRCVQFKELRTSISRSWNHQFSLSKVNSDFPLRLLHPTFNFKPRGLEGYLSLISYQFTIFSFAGAVVLSLYFTSPSAAVDALKTCTCLLKECRIELAKCIANPSCAANIACLQTCNDRPDETECQIKCGDLFENRVVDEFNSCAISQNKCVPQKSDMGEFPAPNPKTLVKSFNLSDFTGKWYITSGLNPSFDTFNCQLHEFHTESNKLVGNITWRVRTPDDSFFTRSTMQTFVQDAKYPGILYNHNNEYLHYEDDWYIISSKINHKEDDYVFVYYRGRNDAWDGYGGAVVYTRKAVLPESIIPELEAAARSVGRDFSSFVSTNNKCEREAPLVDRLEKIVEREVEEIEENVTKVGEKEVKLFEGLGKGLKELQKDEEYFLRSLSRDEMELFDQLKMEAGEVEKLFGGAIPLRKLR